MVKDRVDRISRQEVTRFLVEFEENKIMSPSTDFDSVNLCVGEFLTAACLYLRESSNHNLSTRLVDELISRD